MHLWALALMIKLLICVNTFTVCTLVQRVQCLPDSAVPVSVGPRTQLSPLPDLWCRFSPGKSDFHNSSSTSVTLHHNNPHPRKYSPKTRLKNTHTQSSQRVCSKVEGPGRKESGCGGGASTWSNLTLSSVTKVDWQADNTWQEKHKLKNLPNHLNTRARISAASTVAV